jgi:hypothetical protein
LESPILSLNDIHELELGNNHAFALSICIIFSSFILHCNVQVMEASEKSGEATSQVKSPEQAPMDVSEDEQDEALLKLDEDELQELQKVDSIQCIEGMRISPKEASRLNIPLCRMVYMLLVRPTLANDIKRLEAEFIHGYRHGAPIFYISICN